VLKRAFDATLAGAGLILSAPLWAIFAAAIRIEDGGPVFYRQSRVGLGGRTFDALKFRSMRPDAERATGAVQATEDDPRVTRVGRLMRATAMDELPQLVNILRGDMSFVGPRPIRPVFFEELAHDLPSYWQRLVVRPGLTGLAQVRRGYETSMAEKLAHDLEWIADRSVRLYLRTVVATGWRVLKQSVSGIFRRRA